MSPKLELIARRMKLPPSGVPAPDTSSGLGQAIESMIADEVERRVGEAVDRRPPSHAQQLLDRQFNRPAVPISDYRDLPPVPKTAPKKNLDAVFHRDGAGKVRWVEINGVKFEALRDRAGVLLGMKEITASPVPPPPDIAAKTEARQYQPGKPRNEE